MVEVPLRQSRGREKEKRRRRNRSRRRRRRRVEVEARVGRRGREEEITYGGKWIDD